MLSRRNVQRSGLALMCSSVWKWSRPKVKAVSGAAAAKDV
jgi:hypothetical protein